MTEKLYWSNPLQTSFVTTGARLAEHAGKPSLVLERTLFYPEGGGQLGDKGTLTVGSWAAEVVDTQMDDAGTIHHVLAERPPEDVAASFTPDVTVRGTIDAKRRLDHMTQHTGQHALSRALADVARAETVSARLGATACTIDVQRASIPDSELYQAEELVNALIASNVEVRALYPNRDELAKLPLRKPPKVTEGVIRIIEIEGFDLTPCGGTHCTRTGQIGQVRIVGAEKYKGMLRLTFHAGLRAFYDARSKHAALASIATDLTCGIGDVPAAVGKLRADLKAARAQIDALRGELVDLVAKTTLAKLPSPDAVPGPIVVPVLRENDDIGSLRLLAGKLASDPRVVALAAAKDPNSGELVLVVQRGSGAPLDCGAFVQAQAKARSGRGGGRPERAEGRFPRGTSLEVVAAAAQSAMAS